MEVLDVAIIGSGPCGMTNGIEAEKKGYHYLIFEKGSIANTIRRYPTNISFFSTAELLELEGIPFPTTSPGKRPSRQEAMEYYLKIAQHFDLKISQYTTVKNISKEDDLFKVETDQGDYLAKNVVLAIGYFDNANKINVPGEDMDHVSHFYDEAFGYANLNVAVVGGANSAAESTMELYRHGAKVRLIHRRDELSKSIKYWIKPDLENRIKEGSIPAHWNSDVQAINEKEIIVKNKDSGEVEHIPADFVFLLTGYHPDGGFLKNSGIEIDEETLIPRFNQETYETNVPGIYVAGAVVCGCETANIFIENGRYHAKSIFRHIASKKGEKVED